jgi:hypothetical protein
MIKLTLALGAVIVITAALLLHNDNPIKLTN